MGEVLKVVVAGDVTLRLPIQVDYASLKATVIVRVSTSCPRSFIRLVSQGKYLQAQAI
jgi:hypothetical protein